MPVEHSNWISGPIDYVWHIPAYWVGRAGKMLEFVSGMFIVFDLVGPTRLRAWVTLTKNRLDAAREQAKSKITTGPISSLKNVAQQCWTMSMRGFPIGRVSLLMVVIPAPLALILAWCNKNRLIHLSHSELELAVTIMVLCQTLLCFAVFILVVETAGVVVLTIKYWITRRVTGAIIPIIEKDEKHPRRLTTQLAIGLLVVGFALDFLTS